MSEKTEEPTPKKLRDARKKGQVALSRDATGVITYLAGFALIFLVGPSIARAFRELYHEIVQVVSAGYDHPSVIGTFLTEMLTTSFRLVALIAVPLAGLGLLAAYAQVGNVLASEKMTPKLTNMNPLNQLKNWFSVKGLFELSKTVLKLSVVLAIGTFAVYGSLGWLLKLGFVPLGPMMTKAVGFARQTLLVIGLVMAALGALDLAFQRWQWKKNLKMSKDEVKREFKDQEGDPQIKSERRSIHQEIISQDVGRAVKMADAVVVNPTHLAVTVEYKRERKLPPRVTAKGQGLLAKKIIKLARRRGVPIVRDVPLARALFELEGSAYVPRDLFEAVSEVLLFAWRVREEGGEGEWQRTGTA